MTGNQETCTGEGRHGKGGAERREEASLAGAKDWELSGLPVSAHPQGGVRLGIWLLALGCTHSWVGALGNVILFPATHSSRLSPLLLPAYGSCLLSTPQSDGLSIGLSVVTHNRCLVKSDRPSHAWV